MIANVLSFKLTDSDLFQVRVPEIRKYAPDEIEIWLIGDGLEICLFKDSFQYVLLSESVHTISCFRNRSNRYAPDELVDRYHKYCFADLRDDTLWDYTLFSFRQYETFLSENLEGNAVITIARLDPCMKHPRMSVTRTYVLNREDFLKWFDELLEFGGAT